MYRGQKAAVMWWTLAFHTEHVHIDPLMKSMTSWQPILVSLTFSKQWCREKHNVNYSFFFILKGDIYFWWFVIFILLWYCMSMLNMVKVQRLNRTMSKCSLKVKSRVLCNFTPTFMTQVVRHISDQIWAQKCTAKFQKFPFREKNDKKRSCYYCFT